MSEESDALERVRKLLDQADFEANRLLVHTRRHTLVSTADVRAAIRGDSIVATGTLREIDTLPEWLVELHHAHSSTPEIDFDDQDRWIIACICGHMVRLCDEYGAAEIQRSDYYALSRHVAGVTWRTFIHRLALEAKESVELSMDAATNSMRAIATVDTRIYEVAIDEDPRSDGR